MCACMSFVKTIRSNCDVCSTLMGIGSVLIQTKPIPFVFNPLTHPIYIIVYSQRERRVVLSTPAALRRRDGHAEVVTAAR